MEQTQETDDLLNQFTQPESAPIYTGTGSKETREIRDAICAPLLATQGDINE